MQGLDPGIVLETKLHPPPARPGLVERAASCGSLLGTEAPVVVIGAPAGYGKTTLLAQYAAVADRPVAWLSLDAADGDPVAPGRSSWPPPSTASRRSTTACSPA